MVKKGSKKTSINQKKKKKTASTKKKTTQTKKKTTAKSKTTSTPKKTNTVKTKTTSSKKNDTIIKEENKIKKIAKGKKQEDKNSSGAIKVELPKKKETKDIEVVKEVVTSSNKVPQKRKKRVSNVKMIERTKKNNLLSTLKKYRRKFKMYGIFGIITKRTLILIIIGLVFLLTLFVALKYVAPNANIIDLQSISNDIDQLKTVHFNIDSSNEIVTSSKAYSNLTNYYVYDYESTFNIKEEWVNDAVIKYNKSNKGLYMAILPVSGHEEDIKDGVETFLSKEKIKGLYLEYDGYMFYINSSNNANVVSKIKQTQIRVFDILEELNTNSIEERFNIPAKLYTDYVVKVAMLRSDVTGYMIFKPKNNKSAKEIDELMNEYFAKLEEEYQDEEEKLSLIRNRYIGNYNGYLVYLISRDNDLVMQLVQK